jgi:hypothetical protein
MIDSSISKWIAAAGLAAVLAIPAATPSQAAEGRHAAAAAGAIGGLALGSALGAASQSRTMTTGGGMVYDEPGGIAEDCYIQRRRVWVDGYGYQVRRTQVCE